MILRGEKTTLRPLLLSDALRLTKWMQDREVVKLVRGQEKKLTLKEVKKWIRGFPKDKESKHFAIETLDGIHIGSIDFKFLDLRNRNGEIGITIGDKRFWNKGYGTDAIQTLMVYGFKGLKLHRIDLAVFSYNKRAIAVYKKLGFKKEGESREQVLWGKRFYNSILMGILSREWRKQNKFSSEGGSAFGR